MHRIKVKRLYISILKFNYKSEIDYRHTINKTRILNPTRRGKGMLQKCWECYKMLWTVIWTAKCCKMLRKAMKCCEKLQNVVNCQDVSGTAKCCEMSENVSKCCELSGTVKCCEMLWNVLNCPELSQNDVILKLELDIKVIPWTAERKNTAD